MSEPSLPQTGTSKSTSAGITTWRSFTSIPTRSSVLLATTLLVTALFLLTLAGQREQFEPSVGFARLLSHGDIIPLPSFRAVFRSCDGGGDDRRCEDIGSIPDLALPSYESTRLSLETLPRPATHVLLERRLTTEERAFVDAEGVVSLIVPRNVHIETRLIKRLHDGGSVLGMGSHVTLALSARDVSEEKGVVRLEMKVKGLPWFGPSDLPIVLAKQESTAAFQGLGGSPKLTADLGRQLQIAIPMLLCLIALFFDHYPVFRALAYLSAARAASVFLHFSSQNPGYTKLYDSIPLPLLHGVDGVLVGLGVTSMVRFAFAFTERATAVANSTRLLWTFYIAMPVMFLLSGLISPVSWKRADLVADATSGIIVAIILLADIVKRWREGPTLSPTLAISDMKRTALESQLMQVAGVFTLLLFSLLGISNLEALATPSTNVKTLIDWRFALFYPGLLFVAFLRVGTSSRLIALQAGDLARKRVLESELSQAAQLMNAMQGPRKGRAAGVQWRVWQKQAVGVGGDFFDVRELVFAEGERLLVVLVTDVTGHGIHAAMTTNIIGSAWASWCEDITKERRKEAENPGGLRLCPVTKEDREDLARSAARRINANLKVTRVVSNATGTIAVFDARTREVSLVSAAHPSSLVMTEGKVRTLSAHGFPHFGTAQDDSPWGAKTFSMGEGVYYAYSDGLFPQHYLSSHGAFCKTPTNLLADRKKPIRPHVFWERFHLVRLYYLGHGAEEEDDMTLVSVWFSPDSHQQRCA